MEALLDHDDGVATEVIETVLHGFTRPLGNGSTRLIGLIGAFHTIRVVTIMNEDAARKVIVVWRYADVVNNVFPPDFLNREDRRRFHRARTGREPCILP